MSAVVANLDLRRRGLPSDFFTRSARLIEDFVRDLRLDEVGTGDFCRNGVGAILLGVAEGDDHDALRHWRLAERIMLMPLPSCPVPELIEVMADRNTTVSALATHYKLIRDRMVEQEN